MSDYYSNYAKYLESPHWKNLRKEKLKEQGFCFNCHTVNDLRIHHINYRNLTDCTLKDLVTLCELCHGILHNGLKIFNKRSSECQLEDIREMIKHGSEPYRIAKKEKRKKLKKNKKFRPVVKPPGKSMNQIGREINRRLTDFQRVKDYSSIGLWSLIEDLQNIGIEFMDDFEHVRTDMVKGGESSLPS